MSKIRHFTWQQDFTYDADITMVVGSRNDGKTFGIREQLLRDFRDNKERFSIAVRHKDYISDISKNFFSGVVANTEDKKLQEWFKELNIPCFRLTNSTYEIAPRCKNGKPDSTKWETIGYFTGIAIKQDAKERTYENVRRIILDEAIIEPEDLRFRRYLPDEWGNFASFITSCTKARSTKHKPSAYLLANAVDLINPYFQMLNLYEIPEYGHQWFKIGDSENPVSFLLHMLDPNIYIPYVANDLDLGSRMLTGKAAAAYTNEFAINTNEFVCKKPSSAQYEAGFIYRNKIYALWTDYSEGISYISKRFITGLQRPMYALTTADNKVNYFAAKEARKALYILIDRYSLGCLRFESLELREGVFRLFRDFGIK